MTDTALDPRRNVIGDRYEVLENLGKGSFGETVLARDTTTDQHVAIKSLHTARADDLKAFELFDREAIVLRSLRHPGIPAIVDSFRAAWRGEDSAFLVMEYVEGPTLEALVASGHTFSTEDVLALLLDLAGILDYIHQRVPPILHRDIKPANIILRNGRSPVLVDFGAVRNVFRAPDETGSTVVGTYGYMPYEQYMGQATPASDLYALGATLLHVLTGRPPSEFLTDEGRLGVPDNLPGGEQTRSILTRLLAPAPSDRFVSADAMKRALLNPPTPNAAPADSAASTTATPSNALMPGNTAAVQTAKWAEQLLETLPPPSRTLTGAVLEQYRRVAPPTRRYTIGDDESPGKRALYWLGCAVTFGIQPTVMWFIATARRSKVKPFFRNGLPAVGVIQTMKPSPSSMFTRIQYEFDAGGRIRRGTDDVLPLVGEKWREGDAVAVLYLPDRNFDSVIISTS